MKNNYALRSLLTLFVFSMTFTFLSAQANVRIIEVDPSTERVKFKNFGDASLDISSYRLCAKFDYAGSMPLMNMTLLSGNLNLAPNAEVEITSAVLLDDNDSDFCLYLGSGSFGSASAMVDFVQWGDGGNGRENVAVSKGIWTAGTFLDDTDAPFQYNGNGTENGVAFWGSLLSINEFNSNTLSISPNPAVSNITLEFSQNIDGTIEVFNLLGKRVYLSSVNSQVTDLDISGWASGVYLVKISSEGNSTVERFIKQ